MTYSIKFLLCSIIILSMNSYSPKEVFGGEYLDRGSVINEVKKFVHANFLYSEGELNIDVDVPHKKISLPREGRIGISVTSGRGEDFWGRTNLLVALTSGGKKIKSFWVVADTSVKEEVVVAKSTLDQSKIIENGDVVLMERVFDRSPGVTLKTVDDAVGKMTARRIKAGRIIIEDYLKSAPMIKKGMKVKIVVESPGLRITTNGRAQEDGGLGDSIRVVNIDSGKKIAGEVMDSRTVRVEVW